VLLSMRLVCIWLRKHGLRVPLRVCTEAFKFGGECKLSDEFPATCGVEVHMIRSSRRSRLFPRSRARGGHQGGCRGTEVAIRLFCEGFALCLREPNPMARTERRLLRRVRARRAACQQVGSVHRSAGPSHVAGIVPLITSKKNASIETACGVLHRSLGERRSFVAIRCAYATSELGAKVCSRV
jgi:hypothetical protein